MFEIRKAYPTDAYALINIMDLVWKKEFCDLLPNGIIHEMSKNTTHRIEHLKDQITENNRIFVAIYDNNPIGYIFYAKAQNVVYESAAEIREIYVLPKFQHQGVGKKLFDLALKEIKKLGFRTLVLYCPLKIPSEAFFLKLGGIKKEIINKHFINYNVPCNLIYYDLEHLQEHTPNGWNDIYLKAQENLSLLNNINREVAIISTKSGNLYIGLGIKNKVCPIESALSNMYIGKDKEVLKILILNRQSKPVLPCGRCRDLLISLGQEKAEILFDYGTLRTITMHDLNPYYKDEEKA